MWHGEKKQLDPTKNLPSVGIQCVNNGLSDLTKEQDGQDKQSQK